MAIRNVALLGADGKLGPSVLQGLVDSGHFTVTVLKRTSSKSPDSYPPGVQVTRVPDDFEHEGLVAALRGQDAVVANINGNETETQKTLADAAVAAGVQRFIPADFGSCDSQSAYAIELVPLYGNKTAMREYLKQLAAQHPHFTWTSLVSGHFFDWETKFLHIDVPNQTVDVLDDGLALWSTCTLGFTGRATAKVLEKADLDGTKNTTLYVQSFRVTQMQVKESLERATPGEQWTVRSFDSKAFTEEQVKKRDAGDKEALEELVWLLGTIDADWETRETFANGLLGLEEEHLDTVTKHIVKEEEEKTKTKNQ